ncbi:CAMK family protein kinase [Trichomonas vaginalis G3]|uniref:CAMK family protein kinase n=1 Tax=Trichomonas vaginalis (strain ATCC PRA-98 / G3) TaxID=412133 RepID=A2ET81_TRIV3|nr:protein serine/threonine kinase protein [Trichomonas vaginalis G3]EAY04134.1 CAMK family protein kinase [Trichomonas vaginalis G3]KAI5549887.1 protein serine/threonine kinase protein [Trichomonas vaginalis G3]|eukprot:XP_001316357.1 CAMK family protein kinase [Trichomonas vaginalis G3]
MDFNENIPRDIGNYELIRPIGNGTYSTVYVAREKDTNEIFAIKVTNERILIKNGLYDKFNHELEIVKRLQHPNIVSVKEVVQINHWIFIVQEFCSKGSLYNYILSSRFLTEHETLRITYQILDALSYLHSLGIAHRDIKPENIVFDESMTPKLIDFGFATDEIVKNKLHHTQCGSVAYVAPEVLTPFGYDPMKTDIWSLGITIYVMITGCFPWNFKMDQTILRQIYLWNCEIPETIPVTVRDLLQRMLVKDSYSRASASDLLMDKKKWKRVV